MSNNMKTSLHGRLVGLDHRNMVIAKGFNSADINGGKGIVLPSPFMVSSFDDFTDYTLAARNLIITEGTDAATSVAALLAGGVGGVLRLTTGDAGTGYAADAEQITDGLLTWQAVNGNLVFEARVKLSAITTCYAFVGFTDTVAAALEQPISSAGATTFTTTATDAVGFMYDTGMTSKKWWCTGVANNVDAVMVDSAIAPVAGQYQTFRIEINSAGRAVFFINANQVGSLALAVTPATDLARITTVSKLSVAASMDMDVDYWYASMDRGLDGAAV